MGPYASYIVQTLVTLIAVCALSYAILYGARRLGVGRPRGPIDLVGMLPLEARRSIYLVRVGSQVIVVGASEAGFSKLGELPSADLPELLVRASGRPGADFAGVLAKVLGKDKAPPPPGGLS